MAPDGLPCMTVAQGVRVEIRDMLFASPRAGDAACIVGYGAEIVNAAGEALTAERCRGVDVAVDFSTAAAVGVNLPRLIALGLNVVVGLAGLLDLGYVAFYAVGAYSYALLAKTFGFSFWILLPIAGICGAMFLVIADTVARVIVAPAQLPVGVVTAMVGGPFFLILLIRYNRKVSWLR